MGSEPDKYMPDELVLGILRCLSVEDRCRTALVARSWRDCCRQLVLDSKQLRLTVDGLRVSLPTWLLRFAPHLEVLELGGDIFDNSTHLQDLLHACEHVTWADLSRLNVRHLSAAHDRLHLVPPPAARCVAFPIFGRTDLEPPTFKLALADKLEVLFLQRPMDEAMMLRPPHKLSAALFSDIATYFPQCSGAWPHLRALSVNCHNQLVFDVDPGTLFPELKVLALRGQFSLLEVFASMDTGGRGDMPCFAPHLEQAVFASGHGLSELVTDHKVSKFPDLSRHVHLKTLVVEEGMVRLPICASRLPEGLKELVVCTHNVSRVGQVVRGDLPEHMHVQLVKYGTDAYQRQLDPYFNDLQSLCDLVGVPGPDWSRGFG